MDRMIIGIFVLMLATNNLIAESFRPHASPYATLDECVDFRYVGRVYEGGMISLLLKSESKSCSAFICLKYDDKEKTVGEVMDLAKRSIPQSKSARIALETVYHPFGVQPFRQSDPSVKILSTLMLKDRRQKNE